MKGEKDENEEIQNEYAEFKAQFVVAAGDSVCSTTNTITKKEEGSDEGKEEEAREFSTYLSDCLRKNEVIFYTRELSIYFILTDN